MHITIIALGSLGDVLPCAALGKALQGAGHEVRFATFEGFRGLIEANSLDFHPIQGDAQAIMVSGGGQALAESGQSVARMAVSVMRSFGVMARDYARDLSALASQPTDLIVNQLPGGLYGHDLAEKVGVPMVAAAVMPLVPSREVPMLAFPQWPSFLPGYNLLSHWLAYQIVWQAFRPTINRWRREVLDLQNVPFWGIFGETRKRIPVLGGFSSHAVPRLTDWGDQVYMTGYWFPEEEDSWQPADDLVRFLEGGPPPVFVGFGSMPVRDADRTTALVLEALRRTGQRGIVHTGWGGVGGRDLPEWAFPLASAPYGWLFPRLAAVVHHGGSGTTAFGLRAGVPSVVTPFVFDQYFWGRRISELGVGPAPVPFGNLTAQELAAAIDVAVSDGKMRRRAQVLGQKIQAEDGLGAAVTVLTGMSAHVDSGGESKL